MKENLKNYLPIFLVTIASILLLSILSYVGLQNEKVQKVDYKETKMQYVLVNEDKGAEFEGKRYILGKDFVTLINQDNKNKWETTTRDIANRGIEDGEFDAQIIIPQDFSERLLSLHRIYPEQALVEYRVSDVQNEVTNQRIQSNVNSILQDFNQRIIQMYFSSIIGNLSEAQQNVNKIVGLENDHKGSLEQDIYKPFTNLPDEFVSILDVASILEENNKMFSTEQTAFVDSIKDLMEANSNELEVNSESTTEIQKSIDDYLNEANEKLQTSINQYNEQYNLHQEQLGEQWEGDLTYYQSQFGNYNTTVNDHLNLFYKPGTSGSGDTGVYVNYLAQATMFQESQKKRKEELKIEIQNLEQEIDDLKALRDDVAKKYFDNETLTSSTATVTDAQAAIVNLMTLPTNSSEIGTTQYLTTIDNDLSALSGANILLNASDFNTLINTLRNKGVISTEVENKLNAAYNIVTQYDTTTAGGLINYALPGSFQLVPVSSSGVSSPATFNLKSTIYIDLTKSTQIITFDGDSAVSIELTNIATDMANYLMSSIPAYGPMVTHTPGTNTIEVNLTPPASSGTSAPLSTDFPLIIDANLNVTFPTTNSTPSSIQKNNYWWDVDGKVQAAGELITFLDTELRNDLPNTFKLFTELISIAERITMVYADPGVATSPSQLDLVNFSAFISSPTNSGQSFNDIASTDSLYYLYNNITNDKAQTYIPTVLAVEYLANGVELYDNIDNQIKDLENIVGKSTDQNDSSSPPTLYGTLNLLTKPETFLDEATKLKDWYDKASKEIQESYESWNESEKVEPTSVVNDSNPHPEMSETEGINSELESVITNIKNLASSSKDIATTTQEGAAKVTDIAPDIEQLKESTTQVESNAKSILNNLDKTVSDVQEVTDENTTYAEKFEKVLSNTKNGGADNEVVFNFLSKPIVNEGVFGKIKQNNLIPYYATIIVALLALFEALGLQQYMKRRALSKEDLIIKPSRIWLNLPNTVTGIIVITLLSLFFSYILSSALGIDNKISLFIYTFLAAFSITLLIFGFVRKYRVLTLWIYVGVVSMFFMLSPLLGVTTKAGSIIDTLFKISPFQNIQNGFTVLISGGSVGILSYLVLFILSIVGIILNLIIKPNYYEKVEV